MTTYRLEFLPYARKEWDKLGATLREQFKTQLGERLEHPLVQATHFAEWEPFQDRAAVCAVQARLSRG